MNATMKKIGEISAKLGLTEEEKSELFSTVLDQAYYASLELPDQVELWTSESIAEAFQTVGALSLTELAKQIQLRQKERINLQEALAQLEASIVQTKNELARNWPPVMEESKYEFGSSVKQVIQIRSAIDKSHAKEPLPEQQILNLKTKLWDIQRYINIINQQDQENQLRFITSEQHAKRRASQLYINFRKQVEASAAEEELIRQKINDIFNQIKQSYISNKIDSREVFIILNKLFTSNEATIDIKNATINVEKIQLSNGLFFSELINRKQ